MLLFGDFAAHHLLSSPSTNKSSQFPDLATMTLESGDPFDGASPGPSHMQDIYHDLLGVEVPVEELDHSMPDFHGEETDVFHTAPVANMSSLQGQSQSATDNPSPTGVTIKTEPLDWDSTSRIPINTIFDPIELSDTEEPNPIYRYHAKMVDDTISISESEKDDDLVLQVEESVSIKKEDDEVEFVWEKMGDHVIDLDTDDEPTISTGPNLGNSFLKGLDPKRMRPPKDRSAALRAQEAYKRLHRRKNGIP